MKTIGRKLYIYWGDQIIAIEKYTKGESVELTKNNPIKLFNIVDILGEKMERIRCSSKR